MILKYFIWKFLLSITIILCHLTTSSKSSTLKSNQTLDEIVELLYKNVFYIIENGLTKDLEQKQKSLMENYEMVLKSLATINDPSSETKAQFYLNEIIPKYNEMIQNSIQTSLKFDISNTIGYYSKFSNETRPNLYNFNYRNFKNIALKRQIKFLVELDSSQLYSKQFIETFKNNVLSFALDLNVEKYENSSKLVDFDIDDILLKSDNPKEIEHYWSEIRKVKQNDVTKAFLFTDYLSGLLNGYKNPADYLYSKFSMDNFLGKIKTIMDELRPFYLQLHAYIRHSFNKKYGNEVISESESIPQHLFEQIQFQAENQETKFDFPFSQKLYSITKPKGTNFKLLAESCDQFYKSIGFSGLPQEILAQLKLASKDDKIFGGCKNLIFNTDTKSILLLCPNTDFKSYLELYSALAKIRYDELTRKSLTAYMGEPYPGYTRSIGKAIQLSVQTPEYLKQVGFLHDANIDEETNLNRLYRLAIESILRLSEYYVYEKFRYELLNFKKQVSNCDYWKYENDISGVRPPVKRDASTFDVNVKIFTSILNPTTYALGGNQNLLLEEILGYSIYKNICKKSGQYIPGDVNYPLNKCNLYGNEEAGKLLKSLLSSEAIQTSNEIFIEILGEDALSASGILEYFEPLKVWLEKENEKNKAVIGWTSTNNCQKITS